MRSALLCGLAIVCSVGLEAVGQAQESPIRDNDYSVDLTTGPVLGSTRIVGLGGAYTALAEGIDGAPFNPAAYGVRLAWEREWFAWDATLSFFRPADDFFNTGSTSGLEVENFSFVDVGGRLQFGRFGVGLLARTQFYRTDAVDVRVIQGHYGAAYAFFDSQLVVGVGGRTADLSLTTDSTELVAFRGTALEVGALLGLAGQPWRLGVAGRSPVRSRRVQGSDAVEMDGVQQAGGRVLPSEVVMPWELAFGFAWQLGPRPLNHAWSKSVLPKHRIARALTAARHARERAQAKRESSSGRVISPDGRPTDRAWWAEERKRRACEDARTAERVARAEAAFDAAYDRLPRSYLLLTLDMLVVGATHNGVSLASFIEQQRLTSGAAPSVSMRFGAEAEPWNHHLKLRAGTYREPGRIDGVRARWHGTGGADLRLFRFPRVWFIAPFYLRLTATVDLAPRYHDVGLSLGVWH